MYELLILLISSIYESTRVAHRAPLMKQTNKYILLYLPAPLQRELRLSYATVYCAIMLFWDKNATKSSHTFNGIANFYPFVFCYENVATRSNSVEGKPSSILALLKAVAFYYYYHKFSRHVMLNQQPLSLDFRELEALRDIILGSTPVRLAPMISSNLFQNLRKFPKGVLIHKGNI